MGSNDPPKPPAFPGASEIEMPFEGTRVDLGDDLLERTAVLTVPEEARVAPPPAADSMAEEEPAPAPTPRELDVDDEFESAKILMSEGLLDEAKKVLRRILLAQPSYLVARQKLEEIHQIELKQIFGEGTVQLPRRRVAAPDVLQYVSAETVMRQLDRDLKLGVFEEGSSGEALAAGLSLFQTQTAMQDFARKLDHDLAGMRGRERLDIGIAFLEMGLHDLAVRQFRAAARDIETTNPATSLMAYALILAGRPFEAMVTIEPVLADSEVPAPEKVDFLYLMARAHEGLDRADEALQCYQLVQEAEPDYRDVRERIRTLRQREAARKGIPFRG